MLNELREYEEYSFRFDPDDPNVEQPHRLKYSVNFRGVDCSGMERPMIMVARHFMFDEKGNANADSIKKAEEAVRIWTGIKDKDIELNENNSHLKDWYSNYIRYCLIGPTLKELEECINEPFLDNDITKNNLDSFIAWVKQHECSYASDKSQTEDKQKLKKKLDALKDNSSKIVRCVKNIELLSRKRRQYGKALFSSEIERNNNRNNYREITYKKIVYKAFSMGPLKRYYLCCSQPDVLKRIRWKSNSREKELDGNGKNKDIILKTISVYLLRQNRELTHERKYVQFPVMDTVNWLNGMKSEGGYHPGIYTLMMDDGEKKRIFEKIKAVQSDKNSIIKLRVCEELAQFFELMEENELDKWIKNNPSGTYYIDEGSNKYLKECNIKTGERYTSSNEQ